MRAKLAFVTRISKAEPTLWATGGKPHNLPTSDTKDIGEVSCRLDEQDRSSYRFVGVQLRFTDHVNESIFICGELGAGLSK
jgi:hypothetical protein